MRRGIVIGLMAAVLLGQPVLASAPSRLTETPYQTWNIDQWGNLVPSPNGYLPARNIPVPRSPQDLFFCQTHGEVYLLTSTGIVVLDGTGEPLRDVGLTLGGAPHEPQGMTSIFATPDGMLYITDFEAGQIIKANRSGEIQRIFTEPDSDIRIPGTVFRPHKIVVDRFGRMFVQVFGVFEGIYALTPEGEFINYFGANHVEMTFARALQQIWRRLLTIEQRRAMQAFVPIEYSSLFIDQEGFIYATVTAAMGTTSGTPQHVRKLNPLGVNVLPTQQTGFGAGHSFSGITVDDNGVMTMACTNTGMVVQVDQYGRLMFAFGGFGNQLGMFSRPIAIIGVGLDLWVLDENKRDITVFEITEFGGNVHEAMRLHNEGRYIEGADAWRQVIQGNANYLLAYQGLGRAFFLLEDYPQAMRYFRLAGDRQGYSDAFGEQSLLFMRANFGWFFIGSVVLAAGLLTRRTFKQRRARGVAA